MKTSWIETSDGYTSAVTVSGSVTGSGSGSVTGSGSGTASGSLSGTGFTPFALQRFSR